MNSNAILDRIEIIFYSTLTSCMSLVNRIRVQKEHLVNIPHHLATDEVDNTSLFFDDIPEKERISFWTYISQALVPLIVWMILGFAVGFLFGMIKP
jgi:hypothetical protein